MKKGIQDKLTKTANKLFGKKKGKNCIGSMSKFKSKGKL
jgi:hypothetical protein